MKRSRAFSTLITQGLMGRLSLRGRRYKGKGKEESGRAKEKGKERLQGRHCFLHFSRSDSERENSDWSELIKCQSST